MDRAAMLDALGLAERGERAAMFPLPPPAKFAMFELDGWLFAMSSDHRFASRERACAVSHGGEAVGAYLEEHVMISGAFGASDGRLAWSVQHDPDRGMEHLDTWGAPPAALAAIYAKHLEDLRAHDDADYVFSAPGDLAATVCGFDPNTFDREVELVELSVARKDMMKLREPQLSGAAAEGAPAAPRKPGLLARLFGRG
jgi:hypothetical protein